MKYLTNILFVSDKYMQRDAMYPKTMIREQDHVNCRLLVSLNG